LQAHRRPAARLQGGVMVTARRSVNRKRPGAVPFEPKGKP